MRCRGVCSAGTPNPIAKMTRISGTPRATSTYTVVTTRSGSSTGPVDCRMIATTSATIRIRISAATNIRMFSQSASPTE